MAATKISDIIIPEVFNPYVIERTAELSEIQKAGIIENNPELDRLAQAGGTTINMPFFKDLTGADEVLSDSGSLTPAKITTAQDVAVLLMRGKAWGVNDLAKALSGADPMAAIGNLVAEYWARRRQAVLFSQLKGVFSTTLMTNEHTLNITALSGDAAKFSGSAFVDATAKLGDAAGKLTALGVHSLTYAAIKKANLIDTLKTSDGSKEIPTYMGHRLIVDDDCPYDSGTGVFTTYLFGQGAFGLGNGSAPVQTETDRDSLAGEDYLINRQHFVLHPRGVKWLGASVAGSSPTNAELETTANWLRVYEKKNIRMIAFKHKL